MTLIGRKKERKRERERRKEKKEKEVVNVRSRRPTCETPYAICTIASRNTLMVKTTRF